MSHTGTTTSRLRVQALLVSAALAANNAASYLLTVIAARLLSPSLFGELGALLALMVIGVVPAMGLQTVVALRVAAERADGGTVRLGRVLTLGLTTTAAVTVSAAALSPVVAVVLRLDGVGQALWLALSLAPLSLLGLFHGILQGTGRFHRLAGMIGLEALGKAGGGLVGLVVFGTTSATVAGIALGSAVVAVAGWVACGSPRPEGSVRGAGAVVHAAQAMLALVLLVNLDLVLARYFLSAPEAGEYAVGATLTKIAFWLPSAVGVLVLPRLAATAGRGRTVGLALAVCAGLDAVVVVAAACFGPELAVLIGGQAYAGADLPMWRFAAVGSLLALVQILLFSRIATGDRRSARLIWLAVAAEVALVAAVLHGDVGEVVTAAVVATGLLVVAGAAVEWRGFVRRDNGLCVRANAGRG
ncbi:polysaccharide biosynthesis protein [Actinokineospora guangxiensis]|uniref:Polysaccharide biosynthesis protein n=1 Tax=Actinokineospora guangxiensis TaxID=1490288 RepID=A0ABW0EM44_9PSEU